MRPVPLSLAEELPVPALLTAAGSEIEKKAAEFGGSAIVVDGGIVVIGEN